LENQQGFGLHVMLDLSDCAIDKLNDLNLCFRLLNEVPGLIGMTKITQPYVFRYSGLVPDDQGITGVVIIAESHISLHTFVVKRYAFVDVFSCKYFDAELASKTFIEAFGSQTVKRFRQDRGEFFVRGAVV